MPAGADKGFTFDPPGAIGIVADDARVLLRFHDPDVTVRPKDEAGTVGDLSNLDDPSSSPAVVPAACGNGRLFGNDVSLAGVDLPGQTSLATRDLTIMAIVSWDMTAQNVSGAAGTLVCRGQGQGATGDPIETICYELRLSVVDVSARIGSIALGWEGADGVHHVQAGGQFVCPTGFTVFTATRRWVTTTSVVCHYYIGDVMLAEIWSNDGNIGGSTAGRFTIGTSTAGGVARSLCGVVDELAVFGREMCIEEIADTWQRITVYQPLGVQLLRELHDPGFPITADPSSDVQLEIRQAGMALGYAASLIENFRRNVLPQHAYGRSLELWEEVLRPTRLPTQLPDSGIDARRARVLARMSQRGGSSIPALESLLAGLLGGADVAQLLFLAFSNTSADSFTTIDRMRWDIGHVGGVTAAAGAAHFAPGGGSLSAPAGMALLQRSVGEGRQAHQIVKLTFTTPQNMAEAGVFFGDAGHGNYVLFGLRKDTGSYYLYAETFASGVSMGATLLFPLGGLVSPIWLHLYQTSVDGTWAAAYSSSSPTTGFTDPVTFTGPSVVHWAGCYLRSTGTMGGAPVADFDDHLLYTPLGFAPFNAYVLLDRALGFIPDLPGTRQCLAAIKHAYIHGTLITTPWLLCDDQDNGCDQAPLGGY